jgi:hypothetical protein
MTTHSLGDLVPDVHPRPAYGQGHEAQAVRSEIGEFDHRRSPALAAVQTHLGSEIQLKELKGIVFSIVYYLRAARGIELPPISRNGKRNFALLIKYIENHYKEIVPVFQKLQLLNENREPLPN